MMAIAPTQKRSEAFTKPSEREVLDCFFAKAALHPVAERVDAPVEVEQLAEDDAEHHGEDGDERIAAREHAVETDVEHAQRRCPFQWRS